MCKFQCGAPSVASLRRRKRSGSSECRCQEQFTTSAHFFQLKCIKNYLAVNHVYFHQTVFRHSPRCKKHQYPASHAVAQYTNSIYRLIPKADRKKIHEYLFREGVLVAKKDFESKHGEIDTKNLFVIKACQSLTSRGFLKTQFSWQWYYYTLTPEGLDYLREWLHLPAEIVPQTHVKQARSHAPPRGMMGGEGERGGERRPGGRGGPRGDREG